VLSNIEARLLISHFARDAPTFNKNLDALRKFLIEEPAFGITRGKERKREEASVERERESESLRQQSHARRQPLPTKRKPLLALTSKPTAARRTLVVLCCASK